jgi:hypothetical protein
LLAVFTIPIKNSPTDQRLKAIRKLANQESQTRTLLVPCHGFVIPRQVPTPASNLLYSFAAFLAAPSWIIITATEKLK